MLKPPIIARQLNLIWSMVNGVLVAPLIYLTANVLYLISTLQEDLLVIGSKTEPLARFYEDRLVKYDVDKARFTPIEAYAKSLRDATRGLWTGRFDRSTFGDAMFSAIARHLEVAWREGAAECGIRPDERKAEEKEALERFINNQIAFVPRFGSFIEENNRANGALLKVSLTRLSPWVNRWNEVKAIATEMSCKDQKLIWLLGEAEHCKTCLKLNGRVMRATRWAELDVHPQDTRPGKLICRGFECKCTRPPTNKRATPGPLPRLP